jgi:SAM-dependent methyltransferase
MTASGKTLASLKKTWRRFALRGTRYNNAYRKLDASYAVPDPWLMSSPAEQFRFREINRRILETFGRVPSVLEIGCGEGHHSMYLQQVCNRLTAVDVSAKAVKRARGRCPRANFVVGDIFCPEIAAVAPFDLVVASEVLYYFADVPAALRQIQVLGRSCLVTYFSGEMEHLDPQVSVWLPGARSAILAFEGSQWQTLWWDGAAERRIKNSP